MALLQYKDQDKAKTVATVYSRHLWHLSEHLVALVLFDDVSPEMKQMMLVEMRDNQGSDISSNRVIMDASLAVCEGKTLADFCSTNSKTSMVNLGLATFLAEDSETK